MPMIAHPWDVTDKFCTKGCAKNCWCPIPFHPIALGSLDRWLSWSLAIEFAWAKSGKAIMSCASWTLLWHSKSEWLGIYCWDFDCGIIPQFIVMPILCDHVFLASKASGLAIHTLILGATPEPLQGAISVPSQDIMAFLVREFFLTFFLIPGPHDSQKSQYPCCGKLQAVWVTEAITLAVDSFFQDPRLLDCGWQTTSKR